MVGSFMDRESKTAVITKQYKMKITNINILKNVIIIVLTVLCFAITGTSPLFASYVKSLNFDFESDWMQENIANGTDFVSGKVTLYGNLTLENSALTTTFNSVYGQQIGTTRTSDTVFNSGKYYFEVLQNTVKDPGSVQMWLYNENVLIAGGWFYTRTYSSESGITHAGDRYSVLMDCDNGVFGFSQNGVPKIPMLDTFIPNNVQIKVSAETHNSNGYSQVTVINDPSNFAYSVPEGYQPGFGSMDYPLESYYITTSTGSQIDTSLWDTIESITTTETTPTDTSIKYLASFDGKNTWQYWTGTTWANSLLDDSQTNGMSKTTISAITGSQWASAPGFAAGTLDFAIDLNTTNSAYTPGLFGIDVTYSTQGYEYVCAGLDSLGLGYSQSEKEELFQLYKNGKFDLEPENVTIGGTQWQYYDSEFLPGENPEDPYAIGTSYEYNGMKFIKLGSGIGTPLNGVPEFPASAIPFFGAILSFGLRWLKRSHK